jgi:hypothetical protein
MMCLRRLRSHKSIWLVLLGIAALFGSAAHAQEMKGRTTTVTKSDAQVMEDLTSKDRHTVNAAVDETIRRGARMLPLLVQKKGDKSVFVGSLTRNPESAKLVFGPTGDPKRDRKMLKEGEFVTVEVAAIYLIASIYRDSLRIAQSPYLTDLSLPDEKRRAANKEALIRRAWKSIEAWNQRLKSSSLEKLRSEDDDPLAAADVDFW